jgi:hypothetical protein
MYHKPTWLGSQGSAVYAGVESLESYNVGLIIRLISVGCNIQSVISMTEFHLHDV